MTLPGVPNDASSRLLMCTTQVLCIQIGIIAIVVPPSTIVSSGKVVVNAMSAENVNESPVTIKEKSRIFMQYR